MTTFWRKMQAGAGLLPFVKCGGAISASETCTHFRKEAIRIDDNGSSQSRLAIGRVPLCFNGSGWCSSGDVPAEQFWSNDPRHGVAEAVKGDLLAYSGVTGHVSRIAIAGRPVPIVRVARYIGSARCIRDTYLERAGGGYRLINSPALDLLSAEAGNCRGSYVFYRNWHGATFAILAEKADQWQGIAVFRVDASLQFKSACSKRHIRSASNARAANVQ